MKIFIDTNIFLDVIFNRENVHASTQILNQCYQRVFDGYVADITLLNIDYVASKQSKEIRSFLELINEAFTVVGADNAIFSQAFDINNNDLEDTVQYLCAKAKGCEVIVSNDKRFYRGEIKVLDSVSFIKCYL